MSSLFSSKLSKMLICAGVTLLSLCAFTGIAAAKPAPEPPAPAAKPEPPAPAAKPEPPAPAAKPEPPAPAAKPEPPAPAAKPEAPAVNTEPAAAAPAKPAPAAVDAELAVCPGQAFVQPFTQDKDSNYYTLVEGSEFSGSAGWQLLDGAEALAGERPDASNGGVLNLPAGAVAISPAVCVTLSYPTARTWVENVSGGGGVTVGVYYGSIPTTVTGQAVAQLNAKPNSGWELSNPFSVDPQLGALVEGVREAHFVYANTTKNGDFHVFGLYVDPRMH